MELVIGDRCTGKTIELVQWAEDNNGTIAVLNERMVEYVLMLAKGMEIHIPDPMTHEQLLNGKAIGGDGPIAIDDLEAFINMAARGRRGVDKATFGGMGGTFSVIQRRE